MMDAEAPDFQADMGTWSKEMTGARAAASRTSLFDELMSYRESVFRICLGFSRNYAEAEDLAQDVYLKAYANIGALKNPVVSKEWLFRIAKNTCLDHQKKGRLTKILLQTWATEHQGQNSPEWSVDLGQQLKKLKWAVRRLPRKLREAFVFREYAHLSYEEIATMLGIKEGTVMSRLNRARSAVIRRLKETIHGKE